MKQTRRSFLRRSAAAATGLAAVAAALSPLRELEEGQMPDLEGFLQKHYKEMSEEEMVRALERIEVDRRELDALIDADRTEQPP